MHFILAPNFIGLPALSVPVGMVPSTHARGRSSGSSGSSTTAGAAEGAPSAPAATGDTGSGAPPGTQGRPGAAPVLPVALQLMGPCWHEGALLHAGAVLEAALAAADKATPMPGIWYDVLHGSLPAQQT